jgi:hypothetical protein
MEYFEKKLKADHNVFGKCLIDGVEPDHATLHGTGYTENELNAMAEGVRNQIIVSSIKDIKRSKQTWSQFKIEMTGTILQHLSTSSENRMIQEQNFANLCNTNDIIALYKLVQTVHSIEQDGDVAKRNVITKSFSSINQGSQDYNSYCKKFNTLVQLLKGVKRDRTTEETVEQFMISLSPELYGNEVARLFAAPALIPKDLPAAQRYFSQWGISMSSSHSQIQNRKTNNKNKDDVIEQISFTKAHTIQNENNIQKDFVKNKVKQFNNLKTNNSQNKNNNSS